MKQKTKSQLFFYFNLFLGYTLTFGVFAPTIHAQIDPGCQVKLIWRIGDNEYDASQGLPSGGNSVSVGTAYKVIAQFKDCNVVASGGRGYLRITTPSDELEYSVPITSSLNNVLQTVTFNAVGSYQVFGRVLSSAGGLVKEGKTSLPITVTQSTSPTATPPAGISPAPSNGVTPVPTNSAAVVGTITNPIDANSIGELIVRLIKFLMTMLGALAVLFIIIGGIRMVASQGNESAVKAGKQTVTWAVIGLVVALMAFSFISLVQNVLGRN